MTSAAATPALTQSPGRFWATQGAIGILLCAVIVSLEFAYYFPLVSVRGELGLNSFVSLLLTWGGECMLFALVVGIVEYRTSPRELRAWELALTAATSAFGAALIWNLFTDTVLRNQLGLKLFVDHVGQPVGWVGSFLYHGWLLFFFGGLAVAVRASQKRRTRMLAALRAAELGRARLQQRLAEVTLGSLRSRIDPEFFLGTLKRLEQLYEADPSGADRLLEELIVFLRAAVADIQSAGVWSASNRMPGRGEVIQVE